MSEISTKPYFLRAIYEWCTDNGYTPYIAVKVSPVVRVPMEFVRNGEIVLNISFGATSGLSMDNDAIAFKARFGGVSREIFVPIANVQAIYASENGHGMAFEVDLAEQPQPTRARSDEASKPALGLAPAGGSAATAEPPQKKSEKPFLKIIK